MRAGGLLNVHKTKEPHKTWEVSQKNLRHSNYLFIEGSKFPILLFQLLIAQMQKFDKEQLLGKKYSV